MSSKQKGNRYERKTAKTLGDWWGSEFYRTPASGGLHGWSSDLNVAGDIVTSPESGFPFVVECKDRGKREDWTIENVFTNTKDIRNWWAQVIGDSRRVHKVPLLMFTRNYADDFVMVPYNEEMYQNISTDYPRMRTTVSYIDEVSKEEEFFDVLLTNIEGFMSLGKKYYLPFRDWDWEADTLIKKVNHSEDAGKEAPEKLKSLLDKLSEI